MLQISISVRACRVHGRYYVIGTFDGHCLEMQVIKPGEMFPSACSTPSFYKRTQHVQAVVVQGRRLGSASKWVWYSFVCTDQVQSCGTKKGAITSKAQSFSECRNEAHIIGAEDVRWVEHC